MLMRDGSMFFELGEVATHVTLVRSRSPCSPPPCQSLCHSPSPSFSRSPPCHSPPSPFPSPLPSPCPSVCSCFSVPSLCLFMFFPPWTRERERARVTSNNKSKSKNCKNNNNRYWCVPSSMEFIVFLHNLIFDGSFSSNQTTKNLKNNHLIIKTHGCLRVYWWCSWPLGLYWGSKERKNILKGV